MELPRIKKPEHGMLGGIKSKLGFAEADRGYDERYEDDYGDDYGNYDEYSEYGPDYQDGLEEPAPAGSRYDPYTPVTTRPVRTGYTSPSHGSSVSPPKLVSIDDVRARTQVPESLGRDPLPPRRVSSASSIPHRGERTMVDASAPDLPASSGARAAAPASQRERSESLNGLFAPTATSASASAVTADAPALSARSASAPAAAGGFDPYEAYAGAGSVRHSPTRSLTVLKPSSYGEVERVAKALKAGDAVVLALRNTPDNLSKRILDFSFGVSSALDASVDCVADKVFVITRGAALTDAERTSLRNQGVL